MSSLLPTTRAHVPVIDCSWDWNLFPWMGWRKGEKPCPHQMAPYIGTQAQSLPDIPPGLLTPMHGQSSPYSPRPVHSLSGGHDHQTRLASHPSLPKPIRQRASHSQPLRPQTHTPWIPNRPPAPTPKCTWRSDRIG